MCAEFGITPAARTRVGAPGHEVEDEEDRKFFDW